MARIQEDIQAWQDFLAENHVELFSNELYYIAIIYPSYDGVRGEVLYSILKGNADQYTFLANCMSAWYKRQERIEREIDRREEARKAWENADPVYKAAVEKALKK